MREDVLRERLLWTYWHGLEFLAAELNLNRS